MRQEATRRLASGHKTHFERDHSCSVENELGIQGDKTGHGRRPTAWSRGGGTGAEGSRLTAQSVGAVAGWGVFPELWNLAGRGRI